MNWLVLKRPYLAAFEAPRDILPANAHGDLLPASVGVHQDLLDQQANDLLAIRRAGRLGPPQSSNIRGRG